MKKNVFFMHIYFSRFVNTIRNFLKFRLFKDHLLAFSAFCLHSLLPILKKYMIVKMSVCHSKKIDAHGKCIFYSCPV